MVKAVLFDLDGTLVDAFEGIHESLMHTMGVYGFPLHDFPTTKGMVGHGLEELLAKAMSPEVVPEAILTYRAYYKDIAVSSATPLPGATELLRTLHERGIKIALASNKPSYFCRQIVDGKGWGPYFNAVLGPDLAGATKPSPIMLQAALKALNVEAQDALYVGDMSVDLEAARAANIRVVLMTTGSMTRSELIAAGAEDVRDHLSELLSAL